METLTLTLSEKQQAFLARKVAEGTYTSATGYLNALIDHEEAEQQLHDKLIEGRDSGRSELSHEEFFAGLRARIRGGQ